MEECRDNRDTRDHRDVAETPTPERFVEEAMAFARDEGCKAYVGEGVAVGYVGHSVLVCRNDGIRPMEGVGVPSKMMLEVLDDGNVVPMDVDLALLREFAARLAGESEREYAKACKEFDASKATTNFLDDFRCPCCGERIVRESACDLFVAFDDWACEQRPSRSPCDKCFAVIAKSSSGTRAIWFKARLMERIFLAEKRLGDAIRFVGLLAGDAARGCRAMVFVAGSWRAALCEVRRDGAEPKAEDMVEAEVVEKVEEVAG